VRYRDHDDVTICERHVHDLVRESTDTDSADVELRVNAVDG
jgi:hypothetical protein